MPYLYETVGFWNWEKIWHLMGGSLAFFVKILVDGFTLQEALLACVC